MKLSSKMIGMGCISVASLSILFVVSLLVSNSIIKDSEQIELRDKQLNIITNMQLARAQLHLAAMDSLVDKDAGSISAERISIIEKSSKLLTDDLAIISNTADTDEEKRLAQHMVVHINNLIQNVKVDLAQIIENTGSTEQDFARIDDIIDQTSDTLGSQLEQFSSSVQEKVQEAADALHSIIKTAKIISGATFVIALLVVTTLLTLLTLSITKPIAFAVKGLFAGAEQVSGAASQVSASSQTLAEGASEQAAAIEETSASMEEISSMTKQNADNAGQADSLMKSALGVIKTADTSMSEMNSSMEEISLASVETSKIIKTIDEIAFQTNLLALNAAVEAARAGEAGAGFAVVADEVRNLAMRAAEAAKTTSHLIEETVQKVMKGKKIVVKANEAFKEVAESSAKVGALIDEIATASQEQAHGFGQINKAIVEMDSVTQQNSATAEESAAASEELNAQAETIMDMLRGLKSILDGDVKKPLRKRSNVVMNKAIRPKSTPRTPLLAIPKNPPKKKSAKPKDPSPEEIIPMDHDDEFEDF